MQSARGLCMTCRHVCNTSKFPWKHFRFVVDFVALFLSLKKNKTIKTLDDK